MFLLTFHKENIFSLKKISLSFSPLQLGAEIVAPCIMQRKLFSKKKYFGDHKGKTPVCPNAL